MRDPRRARSDASHGRSISRLSRPCNSAGKHREPFTSHLLPPPLQLQTQPLSSMLGFLLALFQALRRGGREVTFKPDTAAAEVVVAPWLNPEVLFPNFPGEDTVSASLQEPPKRGVK